MSDGEMCPNCVTPWKCNGPHVPTLTDDPIPVWRRGMSSDTHWLLFNDNREVVGCHCGFRADVEEDCGWGDSVVEHLLSVPR